MNTQLTSQKPKPLGSYCEFGAETLIKLLMGTDDLIEGVLENQDKEFVHKTRVASRRLRAALPLFRDCYSKKDYRNWLKEIRKVTRLLSVARDLDVQIAFIEQYIKKLTSETEKPAFNAILRSHKARRRHAQTEVVAGLEELRNVGTINQIRRISRQIIAKESVQTLKPSEVLERSHWHISFRLDDFLSMERYVYQERRKIEHHQMRIYAKKLRYTMECFAPLYDDRLEKEIGAIKAFQDVLGEMHDCDVWLEFIPQYRQKIRKRAAPNKYIGEPLKNFMVYMLQRRRKFYSQFTELWKEKNGSDFFSQLRKKTGSAFMTQNLNYAKAALRKPTVKIALLSDVHANAEALVRVIADAENRGANVFLNAGDSVGFGASPNEAVHLLAEKNVLSVIGNFDLEVLNGTGDAKGEKKLAYTFTRKKLSKATQSYLSSLPYELRLRVVGKTLLLTHGSPKDINEHILPNSPDDKFREWTKKAKADLVVVGHSHEQFRHQTGNSDFINPGSVGRPGDGNPQTAYAMLTFTPLKVELIRLNYDVQSAADRIRKAGLPESYAQMLLTGLSLDFTLKEDRDRWGGGLKNRKTTLKACREFATNRWPDVEHFMQVEDLTLNLFDALKEEHKLDGRERFWLQCAAILHDTGLSKEGSKHHKKSAQIILNSTELPFSSMERRIIACIARYHRKALPKFSDDILQGLNRKTVEKICILAAILRIADALDYTHQATVKISLVKLGAKKISVYCISPSPLPQEEEAFNKKKDLFEKVFNKKTVLIWSQQTKKVNA